MNEPAALPSIDAQIERAELTLQDRQLRLRRRAALARQAVSARLRGSAMPAAVMAAVGSAALWLFARARRPRVPAAPRASARMAAFVAPLVAHALAPSIGRQAAAFVSTVALPFAFGGRSAPRTAPLVRLSRFTGHWYEVARLPRRFERGGGDAATVTYAPDRRGRLRVRRSRLLRDGRVERREGTVRPVRGSGNAKLRVSFAGRAARWLPWAWDEQWILDVAPDYSAALLGTPDRRQLWLLSREPDLDSSMLERLLNRAAKQGYEVDRLLSIEHDRSARAAGR